MIIAQYKNGNADVTIMSNGTREIEYEDELFLDYPLNIDIRTSSRCSFGLNPKTGKAFCDFCHESATTDGSERIIPSPLTQTNVLHVPRSIPISVESIPIISSKKLAIFSSLLLRFHRLFSGET